MSKRSQFVKQQQPCHCMLIKMSINFPSLISLIKCSALHDMWLAAMEKFRSTIYNSLSAYICKHWPKEEKLTSPPACRSAVKKKNRHKTTKRQQILLIPAVHSLLVLLRKFKSSDHLNIYNYTNQLFHSATCHMFACMLSKQHEAHS